MKIVSKKLSQYGIGVSTQAIAVWSSVESFSGPFFSFLLIPLLIHTLGLENYGIYVMAMAFVGFLGFTGLGMSTAITYHLAVNDFNDVKSAAERLGTAVAITLIGTVGLSLVLLIFIYIFHTSIQSHYPRLADEWAVIFLSLILLIFSQCDAVFSSALKGLHEFKTSAQLEFFIRSISFSVVILLAYMFKNVTMILTATVILVFFAALLRLKSLRNLIGLHFNDIRINKPYAMDFLHFGKWMTLQNISGVIFNFLDKLIVGSVLGTKTVGTYNLLVNLSQLIHFIPMNLLSFIMPKVAKNSHKLSLSILIKILIIASFVSCLTAAFLFFLEDFIFKKFSIEASYHECFDLLIVSYILLSFNIPAYFVALGMNLIKEVSFQCAFGSMLGLIVLLTMISNYGVLAAVISKLIYSIAALFLFIPIINFIRK